MPARDADDPRRLGELVAALAVEQRRIELAVGQVARAAEDDEVERLNLDVAYGHDASQCCDRIRSFDAAQLRSYDGRAPKWSRRGALGSSIRLADSVLQKNLPVAGEILDQRQGRRRRSRARRRRSSPERTRRRSVHAGRDLGKSAPCGPSAGRARSPASRRRSRSPRNRSPRSPRPRHRPAPRPRPRSRRRDEARNPPRRRASPRSTRRRSRRARGGARADRSTRRR